MIRANPRFHEVGHDPTIVRGDGRLAFCVLWRVLATERAFTSGAAFLNRPVPQWCRESCTNIGVGANRSQWQGSGSRPSSGIS